MSRSALADAFEGTTLEFPIAGTVPGEPDAYGNPTFLPADPVNVRVALKVTSGYGPVQRAPGVPEFAVSLKGSCLEPAIFPADVPLQSEAPMVWGGKQGMFVLESVEGSNLPGLDDELGQKIRGRWVARGS